MGKGYGWGEGLRVGKRGEELKVGKGGRAKDGEKG